VESTKKNWGGGGTEAEKWIGEKVARNTPTRFREKKPKAKGRAISLKYLRTGDVPTKGGAGKARTKIGKNQLQGGKIRQGFGYRNGEKKQKTANTKGASVSSTKQKRPGKIHNHDSSKN